MFEVPKNWNPEIALEKALCDIFGVEFVYEMEKRELRMAYQTLPTYGPRNDPARETDCPVCKGTGKVGAPCPHCDKGLKSYEIQCPKCHGKGILPKEDNRECYGCLGFKKVPILKKCPFCDGTGFGDEGPFGPCPVCEGSGLRMGRQYAHPAPVHEIMIEFFWYDFNHADSVGRRAGYLQAFYNRPRLFGIIPRRWDDTPNTEMFRKTIDFPLDAAKKWAPEMTEAQEKAMRTLYGEALVHKFENGYKWGYYRGRVDNLEGRPCKYVFGGGSPD